MNEVAYAFFVLAIPFLFGVVGGIEIAKRRPKSTNEQLGDIIHARFTEIYNKGRWLERGSGFAVFSTLEIPFENGRKIELIVKEVA